ncbi:MAG: sn-glycerol-3-phosphate ABC transporter ATP-binding protein UgpC [Candidatus Nanopelagicaceae bacterium]|nr:sn-glycerol-3-phosphate ABC transporter ATP-binding protein UgpC [Candidatus Nanopelagicaceae bacterium]
MMSTVFLNQVQKLYGSVPAVRGVDLEIPDGKFTVLVGPSGCGKTTTLRMIAGLESVTSGSIFIGDKDVTALDPKDRDISMVFQNYALYPHLSVAENIAFPLLARGAKRIDVQARIEEVATSLSISQLLNRKPKELSGGQQQRVAIGRAIARSPRVFLFDEPLSNLDAKLRVEMRTELLRLQRELSTTAVYVTHDQEEAMTLSDVMVVMKDGLIRQMGKPEEIYEEPIDTFVAEFVGSPRMNLIRGRIEGTVFKSPSGISVMVPQSVYHEVVLGVRPEDVVLDLDLATGIPGRLEIIELLGPRAIVNIMCGTQRITAVIEVSQLTGLYEGREVGINFRGGRTHFFEADSGLRIHI